MPMYFTWNVAAEYVTSEPWLMEAQPATISSMGARTYRPILDSDGAFIRFAMLAYNDDDSPLEFARKFGFLGNQTLVNVNGKQHRAELLDDWAKQSKQMHYAVKLFEARRDLDAQKLRNLLDIEQNTAVPRGPNASTIQHIVNINQGTNNNNDLLNPAQTMLESILTANLGHLKHEIDLSSDCPCNLVPDRLLEALWLMLADAIVERKIYRKCKSCQNWWPIKSEAATKTFCDDACRMRHSRAHA